MYLPESIVSLTEPKPGVFLTPFLLPSSSYHRPTVGSDSDTPVCSGKDGKWTRGCGVREREKSIMHAAAHIN